MKNIQRLMCVALTLILALGLTVPAFASAAFADVPERHWAYADVEAAAAAGLMNGTGGGLFSPDMKVSVAQFLTLVGRVVFPDVKAEGADWFGPYVSAAQDRGLLAGTRVAVNRPEAEITRYDMAVILRGAAKLLGVTEKAARQSEVADYGDVPAMYADAVLAVYGMGLIRGDQSGSFNGVNTMTRAEVATVIMRLAKAKSGENAAPAVANVTTLNPGKLTVSTNAAFPPYEMTDDAGNCIGIDMEVAAAIAKKLGLELVVNDMDFDVSLFAVPQGEADVVIAGITVTDTRLEIMDFSECYIRNTQVVVVKEGSSIKTVDDLYSADFIGVQRNTTGHIYCPDDYGEDYVVVYDTGSIAIQGLLNGYVNCVIMENGPAQAFVAANPGLTILDTPYVIEDYAVGVRKGNTQLLDAVNQAIAELRADGTLQSIVDKYIKAE